MGPGSHFGSVVLEPVFLAPTLYILYSLFQKFVEKNLCLLGRQNLKSNWKSRSRLCKLITCSRIIYHLMCSFLLCISCKLVFWPRSLIRTVFFFCFVLFGLVRQLYRWCSFFLQEADKVWLSFCDVSSWWSVSTVTHLLMGTYL